MVSLSIQDIYKLPCVVSLQYLLGHVELLQIMCHAMDGDGRVFFFPISRARTLTWMACVNPSTTFWRWMMYTRGRWQVG